ncbi:MAG TPA: ArsC/Spx/MgsR family protein [Candidatus Acidoferrales bacterium]|nr:ArsC/Spx/MgsR family protein [Candidatus Acidoferrales bacterium]
MKKKAGKAAAKKRSARTAQFLQKPTCTTCRKARAYMEDRGFALHFRDLDKERLSSDELEKLIGDRDHREFLNTRNELFRQKNMKNTPPSRADAIRMMVSEPNLIRRPVIVARGRIVLGFDQAEIDRL